MGEGFRHHIALRLLLEVVVPDLRGAVKRILYVAFFQGLILLVIVHRPDSGVVVGLKFQPDADRVRLGFADFSHLLMSLPERAEKVLDMMTDLMGDHVSVGQVAVRSDLPLHRGEEAEVDIDALVGGTVERPYR